MEWGRGPQPKATGQSPSLEIFKNVFSCYVQQEVALI